MDDSWVNFSCPTSPSFLAKIGLKSSKNALLQVANWALIFSLCAQLACGEKDAVVVLRDSVQNGDDLAVDDHGQGGGELTGHFAGVGSKDAPQDQPGRTFKSGTLRMLPNNCSGRRSTDTSGIKPTMDAEEEDWIGVIYLPPLEDNNGHTGTSGSHKCSILDQVKQAMLFGASALLVLAMNPALLKELDTKQLFSKPIIIIQGLANISKVHKAAQSSHKAQVTIKPARQPSDNSKQPVLNTPYLTLWSTCGRSSGGTYREWEGTVCLGHSQNKIYFSGLWNFLLTLVGSLCLLLLIHSKWRSTSQLDFCEDVEDCLQRLAKASISKMPARRCKKKKAYSIREKEGCAVCLDEFSPGQMLRVLPCYHQFHCKCVDSWLIKKRTCPLCKLNIVDQRFSRPGLTS
ncbi:RING finger protein 215-like isoform X2 [Amphiura filiformis]|uniref:RING finger protein 215-like isoform X2 n=1 Tax=Amphiura filiformis TaxID=82378 RepID=UPI003B22254B